MAAAIYRVAYFAVIAFLTGPAMAEDICTAVATRNVPAEEDSQSILKAGEVHGRITVYRVNKKTGRAVLCSHGGYCYAADGLRLLNCKVGAKEGFDDVDDDYSVDVIRSKVPPALLRYEDLNNLLLSMGLCSACAANTANAYLTHPQSNCARLVKKALEGNPDAKNTLIDGGCS